MKVKYFIPMLLLVPAISWTQGAYKLVMLRVRPSFVSPVIDTFTPGVPNSKRQVASDSITASYVPDAFLQPPLILAITLVDANWNPLTEAHQCTVGVVDEEMAKYVAGVPRGTGIVTPCTVHVYIGRATIYQERAVPPNISEFKFFVKDKSNPAILPDTSFAIDSVFPGVYNKLLLLAPGEEHRPGLWVDFNYNNPMGGRSGYVIDPINAAFNYKLWLHATDRYWNTVPGSPDVCNIKWCGGNIGPGLFEPKGTYTYDFGYPSGDTTCAIDSAIFMSPYIGQVCLKAVSTTGPWESACICLMVEGAPPGPEGMIVISPNPFGAPSLDDPYDEAPPGHCCIKIKTVAIGGGKLRVTIFNHYGYKVREFKDTEIENYGSDDYDPHADFWTILWNGKNDKGFKVGNGVYHVCVEVTQVEKAGVWKEQVGVVW